MKWGVTMRPQIIPPERGSPVHDELVYVVAGNVADALRAAYSQYDRKEWYVLDIQEKA